MKDKDAKDKAKAKDQKDKEVKKNLKEKDRNEDKADEKEKGRSKDKEKVKDKDKQRDKEKEKERGQDKGKEKEKAKEKGKETKKEKKKERDTDTDTEKSRVKDKMKDKAKDKGKDKDKDKEKDKERDEKDKHKDKDKEKGKSRRSSSHKRSRSPRKSRRSKSHHGSRSSSKSCGKGRSQSRRHNRRSKSRSRSGRRSRSRRRQSRARSRSGGRQARSRQCSRSNRKHDSSAQRQQGDSRFEKDSEGEAGKGRQQSPNLGKTDAEPAESHISEGLGHSERKDRIVTDGAGHAIDQDRSDPGSIEQDGSTTTTGNDFQGKLAPKKQKVETAPDDEKDKAAAVVPQHKVKVRCAAMNDDEDFGGSFSDVCKASTPAKKEEKEKSKPTQSKKEKEFAWMDSEEEGDGGNEDATKDDNSEEDKEEDEEITIEILDSAQSFGRMVMLSESLQKWLRLARSAEDVVAVCKALARTKFFDGDIIADLYSVIRTLLRLEKLDVNQTNEVICCFSLLNAYDRTVFGAIARAFKDKTRLIDLAIRKTWTEVFNAFKHEGGDDFLQLLDVPPLLANSPSYKKIRCAHHQKGSCALEASCTYSHDANAPLSLADGASEDWWRSKPLVMTQNQKTMGAGVYGVDRKSASATTPNGWCMPGAVGMPQGVVVMPPGMSSIPATAVDSAMAMAMVGAQQRQQQDFGLQQVGMPPHGVVVMPPQCL